MEKIRIGVFGAGRGLDIIKNFVALGCEIVAVCESSKERMERAKSKLEGISEVTLYEDFDSFIEHDMDAVILANYFYDHAPYAIRCFERGIHVFSECISNGTMAEGVELIRAFEKSSSIYMLAENYPNMLFNREIKRVCDGGTLGRIVYAEGEYNHPTSPFDTTFRKRYNYFPKHWRNYLPRTYYVTHSLGPLMNASGATPKKVTAFSVFCPPEGDVPSANYDGDVMSSIMTYNDDGSVFRFIGCGAFGAHHNAYRVCGMNGQIENIRGMKDTVMLRYNEWSKPEGMETDNMYVPKWNDPDEDKILKGGHGGSDFITARMFVNCIKEGKQPPHPFDVYSAVAMSSVAILAQRSVLSGGTAYDIPDFRLESERVKYENDRDCPCYREDGKAPSLPCCSHPDYKPTEKQIELYLEDIK